MSFAIRLDSERVAVDPGDSAIASIEVTNSGSATDQFEIEIAGLDAEWTALPVPSFSVPAGGSISQSIVFRTPRNSESQAALYPFTVRVRSLESGISQTVSASLLVNSFQNLTMELLPRKGVFGPMAKHNQFQVSIVNLGNSEVNLRLDGSDPEDALSFVFEQESVTLGAGHQRDIEVEVTPNRGRPLASVSLNLFTVSAKSDNEQISVGAQGQLEIRPLTSPGTIALLLFAAVLVFGWFQLRPQPPMLQALQLDRTSVMAGETVRLSWQSSNSNRVQVSFNGFDVVTAGPPNGSQEFTAKESGTFRAQAIFDSKVSASRSVDLEVSQPPVIPDPEIKRFRLNKDVVKPGESFTIEYDVVGEAVLHPEQKILASNAKSVQCTAPSEEGDHVYYIVVRNADKEKQSRKLTLRVVRTAGMEIVLFDADPNPVDPVVARTKIRWKSRGAAKVEWRQGSSVTELQGSEGSFDLDVFESTELTLTIQDSGGQTMTKKLRITIKELEKPSPSKPDAATPPPVTGGGR